MIDCGVLERVADVAVPVAAGADEHVDRIRRAVVEAPRRVEAAAVVGPPDMPCSFSASPIVRSDDGGAAVPALIAAVLSAPFERNPGRRLLIM